MRILITGQSGTCKKEFAQSLTDYVLTQKRGINPALAPSASTSAIQWFEVESKKWLPPKTDFKTLITDKNELKQADIWRKALQSINEHIRGTTPTPTDCLLLIHATGYRDGRFFSPVCWDEVLNFNPDIVITLIDDVYDVWERVHEGPRETQLSLWDALTWRSVEIANARAIARNLKLHPATLGLKRLPRARNLSRCFGEPLPHYVMSVKHSLETFYRLAFTPQPRVVYASFPITRTRGRTERMADIDEFRRRLHEIGGVVVVDPLTIDEMRLPVHITDGTRKVANPQWQELKDNERFYYYQTTRWPIADPVIKPPTDYRNPFQHMSHEQIVDIATRIEHQVVDRDCRLVGQSDDLVAYRPYYPEIGDRLKGLPPQKPAGGVTREISHALELGWAVHVFHPKCDWCAKQDDSLFTNDLLWGRTWRYPTQTQLADLPDDDCSGFADLLQQFVFNN